METIREKAMRAYLKGCDVTVVGASKYSAYKGVVVVIDTVNSAIDLQTPDKLLGYHFCDIRDIRFMDEPTEEETDSDQPRCVYDDPEKCSRSCRLDYWNCNHYKPEEKPDVANFPAESYDVEILWECSSQATYLRERIRKGELILVNDETGAGKIVSVAPPLEREDVAKERWMVYKGALDGVEIRQKCDGLEPSLALVKSGKLDGHIKLVATDAQMRVMAAAPEMLDELEKVLAVIDDEYAHPSHKIIALAMKDVIKKARGEDA